MSRTIELIRWTQERAAQEFDINSRTLSGRIKQRNILPGDDHCFSTLQICEAVFGLYERERIRLVSAEADNEEIEVKEKLQQLVDVDDFTNSVAPAIVEMKRVIRSSRLSDGEQDALLSELSKLVSPVPPSLFPEEEQNQAQLTP